MDLLTLRNLEQHIHLIRGHRVMLDSDLAALYGVETWNLTRAVKRNTDRFPADFAFQLTAQETKILPRQIGGTSLTRQFGGSKMERRGGRRRPPYAFTEEGVAMLSGVLRSDRAVEVNVAIMRAFVKLRQMVSAHKDLSQRLDELERKYNRRFKLVFEAIRELMEPSVAPAKPIGFRTREDAGA